MKYRQSLAVAGAGLVLATGALLGATPASARTPDAVVRAAHFSPTTPGVDVYLSPFSGSAGKLWLSSVAYGTVSPYFRLTPGLYTVALRLHGHSATEPPALQWTLQAVGGRAYTVAGVGAGTSVKGVVIRDDLSTPSNGTGRIRVIQAASRAPKLTVAAEGGPVVAKDAAFATTTPYSTVKSGDLSLDATATGSSVSTTGIVAVKSGTVTSILVLDAQGSGITIRAIVDSSGTANMPRGPVSAGGGGTAAGTQLPGADRSAVPVGLLAMIAVLASVACVATFRLSRARA
jgi:hypothetical protein